MRRRTTNKRSEIILEIDGDPLLFKANQRKQLSARQIQDEFKKRDPALYTDCFKDLDDRAIEEIIYDTRRGKIAGKRNPSPQKSTRPAEARILSRDTTEVSLWFVGEWQRHDLQPSFTPEYDGTRYLEGSRRIFIWNFWAGATDSVQMTLGRVALDPVPSIAPQSAVEIPLTDLLESRFPNKKRREIAQIQVLEALSGKSDKPVPDPEFRYKFRLGYKAAGNPCALEGVLVYRPGPGWVRAKSSSGFERAIH